MRNRRDEGPGWVADRRTGTDGAPNRHGLHERLELAEPVTAPVLPHPPHLAVGIPHPADERPAPGPLLAEVNGGAGGLA